MRHPTWRFAGLISLTIATWSGGASADEPPILRIEPGGHTARVRKVFFTSDSKQLISVGDDKAVRIWDVTTGRQVRTLRPHIGPGREGRLFAGAGQDKLVAIAGDTASLFDRPTKTGGTRKGVNEQTFLLFNRVTSQVVRPPLGGHNDVITSLDMSVSGNLLATGSRDKVARLWNLVAPGPAKEFKGHTGDVNDVAISPAPEEKWLASAGADGEIRVWDVATSRVLHRMKVDGPVYCVAWSPDARALVTGGRDKKIHLWDPQTGRELGDPLSQPDAVICIAVSPDGKWLLSGSGEDPSLRDARVRVWPLRPGAPASRSFDLHSASVLSVAFSPDGRYAASADRSGTIYLWDPETAGVAAKLAGMGKAVTAVAWSRDGHRVAWSTHPEDGKRPLEFSFDLATGALSSAVSAEADWIRGTREHGGKTLSVRPDRRAVMLDGRQKPLIGPLDDPTDEVGEVVFAPDGRVVLGADFDLAIFDSSGNLKQYLDGHDGPITSLAVSQDGKWLVSGSEDQTVRIWKIDAPGNRLFPTLSIFRTNDTDWIAWTPEGYYNASAQGDRYIGWQVNQGRDNAAKFYEAERFSKIFYRPDVIFRLFSLGTLPKALAAANADPASPFKGAPPHDIGQVVQAAPPDVIITSPAEGAVVRDPDITVDARFAAAARPGVEMRAIVAEAPSARDLGVDDDDAGAGPRRLSVHLLPGRNTIRVFGVETTRGEQKRGQATERVVVYQPAGPRRARYGSLYMLSIGVSAYRNTNAQLIQLPAATVDATEIANLYSKQQGKLFDETHIDVLPDDQATKERVMEKVKELSTRAKPGDFVVLFLSGHGVTSLAGAQKQYDTEGAYRYFFAPVDFKNTTTDWDRSGVDWQWILQQLRRPPCPVLLFIDTCHSGGLGIEMMRGFNVLDLAVRGAKDRGIYAITSCLPSETSREDIGKWGHGAFTKGILAALEDGKARRNSDGMVPFNQAHVAITEFVSNLVAPEEQHPKAYSPPDAREDLPIYSGR